MARKTRQVGLACPNCNSSNVQFTGDDKKGYNVGRAILIGIFTLGIGLLMGLTGRKAKNNEFLCLDCGRSFKRKK